MSYLISSPSGTRLERDDFTPAFVPAPKKFSGNHVTPWARLRDVTVYSTPNRSATMITIAVVLTATKSVLFSPPPDLSPGRLVEAGKTNISVVNRCIYPHHKENYYITFIQ